MLRSLALSRVPLARSSSILSRSVAPALCRRTLTTPVSAKSSGSRSLSSTTAVNTRVGKPASPLLNMVKRRFATTTKEDVKGDTEERVPIANMRNLAIIAHVDHGKTTLVDCLLRQSNTRIASSDERIMDSNALERERGITILAKNTSILWKDAQNNNETYRLNIVDTPGHADFGGEVERIMSMVDGVCLIVDAADGPMTQTKFVLSKALKRGLKPIVVINKVDRPNNRVGGAIENEVFDLFAALDANDEQLDYPVVYASAREGFAFLDLKNADKTNMQPLFRTIVKHIPAPVVDNNLPFSMLVTMIEANVFLGKCLLGRVATGKVKTGDKLNALDPQGDKIEEVRVSKILTRRGLDQVAVDEGRAGDIISLAGFSKATVNSTLCAAGVDKPIPSTPIDPPTVAMSFSANTSPLQGKEGTKVTNSMIGDRLRKEVESNVALRMYQKGEAFEVHGRGELQLGVLIENMRREGFELSISPPRVVYKTGEDGERLEPLEEVFIDCDPAHSGSVLEALALRKGEVHEYQQTADGRTRLVAHVPTRGLLGFRNELNNLTQGSAIMNHLFHSYVKYKGPIERNTKGAIISMEAGQTTMHALNEIQSRGVLFVVPGMQVYPGMVIGENSRDGDLTVNPTRAKAFSNVRSVIKEEKKQLTPARLMTLEEVISYMRDDEIIEVTPSAIRLRKRFLNAEERKAYKKQMADAEANK